MRRACIFSHDSQAGLAILLVETSCPKYFPFPLQTLDVQLCMLVPLESTGEFERGDIPLQSNAVPSLQMQATGVSAPEAFPDEEPSPELCISLERWEPPGC